MAELKVKNGDEQPARRSPKKVFKYRLRCVSFTRIWNISKNKHNSVSLSDYEKLSAGGKKLQSSSAKRQPAGRLLFCFSCCFIGRRGRFSGRGDQRASEDSFGMNSAREETRTPARRSTLLEEIMRWKTGGKPERNAASSSAVRLNPSPATPSSLKDSISGLEFERKSGLSDESAESKDACKRFRNYLVEMIVEDGDLTDLTDVEELLYCYRHLKSPVYRDLISRFYVELCNEIFSESPSNLSCSVSEQW